MKRSVIWIAIGVVALVIVAYLVSHVGNVAIRRVQQDGTNVTLNLSQPVVLGVETAVRWNTPLAISHTPVVLKVRTVSQGEQVLGKARLSDNSMKVTFPCGLNYNQASIVMYDERTVELITWLPLTTLPAGQDCAR